MRGNFGLKTIFPESPSQKTPKYQFSAKSKTKKFFISKISKSDFLKKGYFQSIVSIGVIVPAMSHVGYLILRFKKNDEIRSTIDKDVVISGTKLQPCPQTAEKKNKGQKFLTPSDNKNFFY